MRHRSWLLAALFLSGCASAPPQPRPDREAIRKRAEAMDSALEQESAKLEPKKQAPVKEEPKAPGPKTQPPPPADEFEEAAQATILDKDPRGCTWVEAEGKVSVGENDTKSQVKAAAVADARSKAMNKFLGVSLDHKFIDFQQEGLKGQVNLTENLLRVTRLGRELDEKVISSGYQDLPDCPGCRYRALVRTCLVPQQDKADKGFEVKLELNRTKFVDGDEAITQATPTRDSYIYILDVDMSQNASLIFPNDAAKDNKVRANETLVFPSEEFKRRIGQDKPLYAELPKGLKVSAEMIRVIASKGPLPKSVLDGTPLSVAGRDAAPSGDGQAGTYLNIMRKLNACQEEWVDDSVAFTIFEK